jgi:hypothetical protein
VNDGCGGGIYGDFGSTNTATDSFTGGGAADVSKTDKEDRLFLGHRRVNGRGTIRGGKAGKMDFAGMEGMRRESLGRVVCGDGDVGEGNMGSGLSGW